MITNVAGRTLLASATLLVSVTGPGGATAPLVLRMSPAQSFAPALVRIRIDIEPAEENRRLVIAAESGGFFRSSDIPLAGHRAPRVHEMRWDGLPSGEYVLQAELHGVQGERATERIPFVVIDSSRERP